MIGQTRINTRALLAATVVALLVALVSLAARALVISAMGWLVFELLAVLSTIFLTTPNGTAPSTLQPVEMPKEEVGSSNDTDL